MRYIAFEQEKPLAYLSSGLLHTSQTFLHPKRNIDSTVFIFVTEGTLYISQDGYNYELSPHQFITLYENHDHWGWKKSVGDLSYYWVHFRLPPSHRLCPDGDCLKALLRDFPERTAKVDFHDPVRELYILPDHGSVEKDGKLQLLFSQLLDYANDPMRYSSTVLRYALSLLLIELAHDTVDSFTPRIMQKPSVDRIQNWIQHNYHQQISVQELARQFRYNPDYLSSDFKKHAGISLVAYIRKVRIEIAKNLLSTFTISIKETAHSSGFSDEKYFSRVFKQVEGVTPSQYKKAFYKKKVISS